MAEAEDSLREWNNDTMHESSGWISLGRDWYDDDVVVGFKKFSRLWAGYRYCVVLGGTPGSICS